MTTSRSIRQIIEERGWTPGSSLENRVALILSRGGFRPGGELLNTRPHPRRPDLVQQYQAGRYRLDFAAPDVKIAIEADGWHHRSPEGAAKDAERDSWLRSHGWIVLRVDDRHGEDSLEDQIARAARLIWLERNAS